MIGLIKLMLTIGFNIENCLIISDFDFILISLK